MKNTQITSTFLSNGLIYGLNGIYQIMPIFLAQFFGKIEMGYLLAIHPLVLCIAPLFWGGITDRAKTQNSVLAWLVIGACISLFSMLINQNFYFIGIALVMYSVFQSPFGATIDVLTIRAAEKFNMNYGFFRITGALMFGIIAFYVTLFKEIEFAFVVSGVVSILACISVLTMPKVVKEKNEKSSGNIKEVLVNKELWIIISVLGLGFFTWGYYSNFFPTYITETLGLSKSVWGIVVLINVLSEVPFFVYYSKIFAKISIKNILLISSLLMLIRWIVFATVKNTTILIGVSLITGLSITVLTYCATYYIAKVISPNLVNRAQSLVYAIGTGVPKMLAACIGGYMTEYLTEPVSFAISAVLSGLGVAIAILFKNTMKSIDKKIRT